jgi:hexosaminidase
VKKYLDLLARYKMNVFHWHLTDDQGWRIEIEGYPELTDIAAWRSENGKRYGGYYSRADIEDIVAYARERFVTIVPEIEMPGHALAALAAYPELSCTGGTFEVKPIGESLMMCSAPEITKPLNFYKTC